MASETADRLVRTKVNRFVEPEVIENRVEELTNNKRHTRLPNFRLAVPEAYRYSDEEILAAFKEKYSHLEKKSDDELVYLIEAQYSKK
jgi:hypothetical protein